MTDRPAPNALRLGVVALFVTSVAAFAAAWALRDSGLLSPIPPGAEVPDVAPGDEMSLYQSAFTAWAALLLLGPVYIAFWFRNASARAWEVWRAFWTVSALAYLIHLAVAMFGFFGGDFDWMTSTSRVSAFWPGMVIAIWWPLDAALAWRGRSEAAWVLPQRYAIHLVVLVLFVGGSLGTGELWVIRVLGAALLAVALLGLVRSRQGRRAHG